MPSAIDRFVTLSRASGTRLLMVGAVVGAVAALAITVSITSAPPTDRVDGGPRGGGMPASSGQRDIKYSFAAPVGTCLTWRSPDAGDMRQVACAEAHIFEVTEVIDISDDFPPDAEQPDVAKWREIAVDRCTEGAATYLSKPLDPAGKLQVSALRPNSTDWQNGQRSLRCGLWRTGPGGSLQGTKGPAVEQDQSDIWAKGTCLGLDGKTVGDPVNCEQKHSYEMIAVVNLRDEFDEDPPSKGKQESYLDKTCSRVADKYTGGMNLKKKKLIVSWDIRSKESWRAGSYLVNCKVAALLDDKSGLAPVTGSIAEKAEKKKEPSTTSTPKNN